MSAWTDKNRVTQMWIMGAAGVAAFLVFLGSFLPWVTLNIPFGGNFSRSGIDLDDGIITLILAIIALVALVVFFSQGLQKYIKLTGILLVLCGLICLATAIYDMVEIYQEVLSDPDGGEFASYGAGLYMVAIGSLALIAISSWILFSAFKRQGEQRWHH